MKRRLVGFALLWLGCVVAPVLAQATTYGNLTRKFGAGRVEAGFTTSQTSGDYEAALHVNSSEGSGSVSDTGTLDIKRDTVTVRYGLNDNLSIGALTGNVEFKDEFDDRLSGREVGAMFWNRFAPSASGFEGGLLLAYRTGSLSNRWWSGEVKQLDIGIGGAKTLSEQAAVFFDLIYSKPEASIDAKPGFRQAVAEELSDEFGFPVTVSKLSQTFTPSSPLLLVMGVEVAASSNIALSLELHAVAETGFALGVTAGF